MATFERREITPGKKGADPEAFRIQRLLGASLCAIRMSALSSASVAAHRHERLDAVSASTVNREFNVGVPRRGTQPATLQKLPPQTARPWEAA